MQGSVIRLVNGFRKFGSSQENNWYWSYGTQYACNGYYASTQQTGAGSIGRELINRIPNDDARKALFLTEDKFPGYNFNDGSAMDLGYGILGMGDDEKKQMLFGKKQLPIARKWRSVAWKPLIRLVICIWGTTEVLCIRHSGRQLPAFHPFIGNGIGRGRG